MAGLRLTHPGLQHVILHRLSWTCSASRAGWTARAGAWPGPVSPPFQAFWSAAWVWMRPLRQRAWHRPVARFFPVQAWLLPVSRLSPVQAWLPPVSRLSPVQAWPPPVARLSPVQAWRGPVARLSPVQAWRGPVALLFSVQVLGSVARLSPVRRLWQVLQPSWARPVSASRLQARPRAFSRQAWPWAQQRRVPQFLPQLWARQPWPWRPAWRLSAWTRVQGRVSHSPNAISQAWKTKLPATRPR